MLDLMTPEQFRERFAYWLLTDQRDPRLRHAELIAEIHNTITRYICAKNGQRVTSKQLLAPEELLHPMYGGKGPAKLTQVEDIDPEAMARAIGCI